MDANTVLDREFDEVREEEDKGKELNGMLLSHCLIYKNSLYDERFTSLQSDQWPILSHTLGNDDSDDIAVIYHNIDPTNIKENKSRAVRQSKLTAYFSEKNIQISSANSSDTSGGAITWIHIVSEDAIVKVFKIFGVDKLVLKSFLDKSPRSYGHRFTSSTTSDIASVTQIVSVCLCSDMIHTKVLHCYTTKKCLITFERQIYVVAHSADDETPMRSSTTGDNPGQVPRVSLNSQLRSTSISHVNTHTRSAPLAVESIKYRGAGDLGGDSDYEAGFTTSNPLLKGAATPAPNNISSKKSLHVLFGDRVRKIDNASSILIERLTDRIENFEVKELIKLHGSSYLLYECFQIMLSISYPAIEFLNFRMLSLHDNVFVRKEKPGYREGNKLRDRIDTIDAILTLFSITVGQTFTTLKTIEKKYTMEPSVIDDAWFSDIVASYEYTSLNLKKMRAEVRRIEANLLTLLSRRNDRINLLLSMVATIFLPLSFLTGVFGMNFDDGGALVYVIHMRNGAMVFWLLFMLTVLVLVVWFMRNGFFEMLTNVEKNKHTEHFSRRKIVNDDRNSINALTLTRNLTLT